MTQVLIRPTDDPKDTTLQMRVSASFLKKIDDWRRRQPDLPSRAEAIRRLVDGSLEPLSMSAAETAAVESWIRKQKHPMPLADAIRQLVSIGLKAKPKG